MTKKRTTFITLMALAGMSFLASIISFINLSELKLQMSSVIVGEVKDAFITERLVGGVKYKKPQTIFYFKLFNSPQNFAIHRSDGGYSHFERNIRPGTILKVYYRPSTARFNTDVYQVEKSTQVLYAYETYTEQASNKAGYMLLGGIVIAAIGIFGYTDISIIKLLKRLVEGK